MFISLLPPPVSSGDGVRQVSLVRSQLRALGRDRVAFVAAADVLSAAGVANDGVDFEPFPADLLSRRLTRLKSRWKLHTHVQTRRVPELETALARGVERLRSRHGVTALVAGAESPVLTHLTRRHRLPILHCEPQALDEPAPGLARVDLRATPRRPDVAQRFRTFCWQRHRAEIAPVSRDELLHLAFGRTAGLAMPAPSFRLGLVIEGEAVDCVQRFRSADLVSLARDEHDAAEILIRHQPAALAHFGPACGVTDRSPTPAEFIGQCETVATVTSVVALEAMLMGRRTLVMGDSPLRLAADPGGATRRHAAQQLLALNFIVGCLYAPADLVFNAGYLEWRLGQPSELAVFEYHINWLRERRMGHAQSA